MSLITSIKQLIDSFENTRFSEQVNLIKKINIPSSRFKRYATWAEGGYTRNCIAREDDFEFILLCWDSNSKTKIHDHAGQNCWIYQIQGDMRETRFKESDEGFEITHDTVLREGKVSYMHDRMGYHSLENISGGRSMTLHIYASPIDQCQVYNEDTSSFEVVEMEYDTINTQILEKQEV